MLEVETIKCSLITFVSNGFLFSTSVEALLNSIPCDFASLLSTTLKLTEIRFCF